MRQGGIAYSPDGSLLALGGGDRLTIMDTSTFEVISQITVGETTTEFSPDGSLLVAASPFTRTRLYDTRSWEYRELDTTSYVANFTSDGERVMTGDLDRFVRLWDVETGAELVSVQARGFDNVHGRLDDETMLMSSGSWLQVITFDLEALLEEGISRLSRNLSEEECERYLRGACE